MKNHKKRRSLKLSMVITSFYSEIIMIIIVIEDLIP